MGFITSDLRENISVTKHRHHHNNEMTHHRNSQDSERFINVVALNEQQDFDKRPMTARSVRPAHVDATLSDWIARQSRIPVATHALVCWSLPASLWLLRRNVWLPLNPKPTRPS